MKRHRDERGQAMVEFTLIATVLATLLLAVFQFGVAFSNYISVADAARAGARKASTDGATSTYVAATEAQGRADAIANVEGSSGHTCATDNWCTSISAPQNWVAGAPVAVTVTAPFNISIFGLSRSRRSSRTRSDGRRVRPRDPGDAALHPGHLPNRRHLLQQRGAADLRA